MSTLAWGKPKIEFAKTTADGVAPTTWTAMPDIVTDTTKLNSEQGEKKEAIAEGGDIVDVRYSKSKYSLEFELFVKKGDEKPIEDEDGIITDSYAVRLTPEDPACQGFIIDKASVAVLETWSSADGARWKYTFSGLKPKTGKIMKPYNGAPEA